MNLNTMMRDYSSKWLELLVCIVMVMSANGFNVSITYVQDAVAKGGVCLDGSPPAYHLDKGFGDGVNNWLIHLEGGAWCSDATSCLGRAQTSLGSSKLMSTNYSFSGILSNKANENPGFYNWNRVVVRYCDGSSYTGDVEAVDPTTKVFYRGARLWRAVMDDLLGKGMENAQNAILAGCSAGAMGAILQCDNFQGLLPCDANVKCLSDAGFFVNIEAVSGARPLKNFFAQVVTTHGSAKNLPEPCTSIYGTELCILPQYAVRDIQTPLFLLNPAYDMYQSFGRRSHAYKYEMRPTNLINSLDKLYNFLQGVPDPEGKWRHCKNDITRCSENQILILQDFNTQFINELSILEEKSTSGLFINSCYCHCQSEPQETWFRDDSPRLDNTTIAEAVGDWFYDRNPFKKIDCPYPCDETCHNVVQSSPSLWFTSQ